MDTSKFVEQHIVDCLRAAVVEANGEEAKATRLRAQAKLRLVCMTDDEIWELAKRTSFPPKRLSYQYLIMFTCSEVFLVHDP